MGPTRPAVHFRTPTIISENSMHHSRCSAFSPLTGFMAEDEYKSVVDLMHMPNGLIFGLPVVLDTEREDVVVGDRVLLTYQGQVGGCVICVCILCGGVCAWGGGGGGARGL